MKLRRAQAFAWLTVPPEEVPANSVPAAAVRRKGQALSGLTGCKGCVGCFMGLALNPPAQPGKSVRNYKTLSLKEEGGTPGVTVKCVDIRRNTGGEGGSLVQD